MDPRHLELKEILRQFQSWNHITLQLLYKERTLMLRNLMKHGWVHTVRLKCCHSSLSNKMEPYFKILMGRRNFQCKPLIFCVRMATSRKTNLRRPYWNKRFLTVCLYVFLDHSCVAVLPWQDLHYSDEMTLLPQLPDTREYRCTLLVLA